MFRTSNPTLNPATFEQSRAYTQADAMTIQGTVNKCFFLLLLVILSAVWVWNQALSTGPAIAGYAPEISVSQINAAAGGYVMFSAIAGFIAALVTIFKRDWSPVTAPIYALLEGMVLGGVSAMYQVMYEGIVGQAVMLTVAVLLIMLVIYKTGIIPINQKFMMGLTMATGAIFLVYLCSWIFSFFGRSLPFIYSSTPMGIGFSVIVVGIAAFNLLADFYMIEQGSRMGAKKYMEWYGAFGLMVTLIWLYLEILRLLAKMRRR